MNSDSDKQNRILEAALALFVAKGLRKTTVEQIAAAAGIGKGTLYLYFDSKRAVIQALAWREAQKLMAQVRSAVRREQGAEAQLRAFLRARLQGVRELVLFHGLEPHFFREARTDIEGLYLAFGQLERAVVEDILEGGVERGELAVPDVAMTSLAITASLRALDEPWLYEGRELGPTAKVDALAQLFTHGLLARGPSAVARLTSPGGQERSP